MSRDPAANIADLQTHLDWSDGPFIAFIFAERPADARMLRAEAGSHLDGQQRRLITFEPDAPDALRGLVPTLLEPEAIDGTTWVDAPWFDIHERWRGAWIWLLERLNERREQLLAARPGGLFLALHDRDKATARQVAPDLWSIHALALDQCPPPRPEWVIGPRDGDPDGLALVGVGPIGMPPAGLSGSDITGALANWRLWPSETSQVEAEALEARLRGWSASTVAALGAVATDRSARLTLDLPWSHPAALAPWEWLPGTTSMITGVRRRLPGPARHAGQLPLRVLLVLPDVAASEGVDPFSGAEALVDGLEPLADAARIEALRPGTLSALADRLRAEPVDVLYLHGLLRRHEGTCEIALEADGASARRREEIHWVPLSAIAAALGHEPPGLVILDAAFDATRRWSPDELGLSALEGVAAELLLPPPLPAAESHRFWLAFWTAIRAYADIGDAVAAGRVALSEATLGVIDSGLPILGQRGPDRPLIPPGLHGDPIERPPTTTLPPPPAHGVIGRVAERQWIDRALDDQRIVLITGLAGQGKTTLAVAVARWASRVGRFPGGAVFVDLAQCDTPEDLVRKLSTGLGIPTAELPAAPAVEDRLRDRACLLILDGWGARSADVNRPANDLAQWVGRLAVLGGTRVLITSRQALPPQTFSDVPLATVALGSLLRPDAMRLLREASRSSGGALSNIDPYAGARLVDFTAGHPPSIIDIGSALVETPARQFLRDWSFMTPLVRTRLDALPPQWRRHTAPLAILWGGASVEALGRLLDIARDEAQRFGERLVENTLAVWRLHGLFLQLHPVLTAASDLGPDTAEHAALLDRRDAAYQAWLADIDSTILPGRPTSHLVREELPNLMATLEHLDRLAVDPRDALAYAVRLERAIGHLARPDAQGHVARLRARWAGQVEESGAWSRDLFRAECLAVDELERAGRLDEATTRAEALVRRADAAAESSEDKGEALFERAFARSMLVEITLRRGAAESAFEAIGVIRSLLTDPTLEGQPRAAALRAACYSAEGRALARLGRHADAHASYARAAELCQALDDQVGLAQVLADRAQVHLLAHDPTAALADLQRSRAIREQVGDAAGAKLIWHRMGLALQEAGRRREAEHAYREALAIADRLGDLRAAGDAMGQLAGVARAEGRLDEAIGWIRRALEIHVALGDHGREVIGRANLGWMLFEADQLTEAREQTERAATLADQIGLTAAPWARWHVLARIREAMGDADGARQAEQRARDWYARWRDQGGAPDLTPSHMALFRQATQPDRDAANQELSDGRSAPDTPAQLRPLIDALLGWLGGDPQQAENLIPDLDPVFAEELRRLIVTGEWP